MSLVLDTEALVALEHKERQMWIRLKLPNSAALDKVALFAHFVLEGDLHLGAIGDHLAVIDLHVEVGHFGNSQVAQR
jgi:hypothetical protein